MSNNIRKSSLEQAKTDFEEIRNFAQQQIEAKLQEEVDKKILEVINEEINISVDEDGNVEVEKDGEEIFTTSASSEEESDEESEDEFIEVSDDEEPIEVSGDEEQTNENMLEMNRMTNEAEAAPAAAPAPAPAAPAAEAPAAPAAEAPVEEPAAEAPVEEPTTEEPTQEEGSTELEGEIKELISKIDVLVNAMMQQQGVASDEQGGEQEFEVVDDESGSTPAPADEIPAPAPVQEMQFEIEQFEEGHDIIEIIDEELEEADTAEEIIVDEDEDMPTEGWMEETRSLGFASKRTGDKALKMSTMDDYDGHHAPVTALKESKIKAQYESKLGELTKENKGLQTELKSLKLERKEFEEAFIQLREQFDEMQTFNGKLALVNKLLMNGGLSFEQKLNVCEQFDGADTIEEAEKIYKSIIKENNIKVNDASNKIKASTTHTAKATSEAKPLYESAEAKRMKELAGMSNRSEN